MRRYWIAIIATVCCSLAANVYADTDLEVLKAAHKGDVDAMRRIGIRMYKGCSRGNPTLGIEWLKKAANRGDVEAMYFLGRVLIQNDRNSGLSYLRQAANNGHKKAKAVLRKETGEDDRTDYVKALESGKLVQVPGGACSVKEAVTKATKLISDKALEANIKAIAMVDFLCNGGKKTELSDSVRDAMQEALVSGSKLEVTDRVDTGLLIQEGQAQQETVDLRSSTAVFMGEIICAPERNVGYFAYRVFNTLDMRILAAGFIPVKWSGKEKNLLKSSTAAADTFALPITLNKELEGLVEKVSSDPKRGIAMVYSEGDDDGNIVDKRVAFAQILATMFDANCELYEREFYRQASEEASVSGNVVQAEKVGALCTVEFSKISFVENNLKVKITAYPKGSLLAVDNLKQKRVADVDGHAAIYKESLKGEGKTSHYMVKVLSASNSMYTENIKPIH